MIFKPTFTFKIAFVSYTPFQDFIMVYMLVFIDCEQSTRKFIQRFHNKELVNATVSQPVLHLSQAFGAAENTCAQILSSLGQQDVGHLDVATGRGALSLSSSIFPLKICGIRRRL